jgi:hypothetical protein
VASNNAANDASDCLWRRVVAQEPDGGLSTDRGLQPEIDPRDAELIERLTKAQQRLQDVARLSGPDHAVEA